MSPTYFVQKAMLPLLSFLLAARPNATYIKDKLFNFMFGSTTIPREHKSGMKPCSRASHSTLGHTITQTQTQTVYTFLIVIFLFYHSLHSRIKNFQTPL